jgi:hypothetical protein
MANWDLLRHGMKLVMMRYNKQIDSWEFDKLWAEACSVTQEMKGGSTNGPG